jgi:hypothetical protein
MADKDLELFAPYNRTELIQACQEVGISVSPAASREELTGLLTGSIVAADPSSLDAWRHGIMGFVLDHWDTLSTQLTCPARTKDPRACFGCIDTQVVSCLNSNDQYINEIARHRREERGPMSNEAQQLTIANAPRTVEELAKHPFVDLRRLLKQLEGEGDFNLGGVEESRAFYTLKDPIPRAQKVLEVLQKYDTAKGGGAPAAEAPPKKTPGTRATKAAAAAAVAEVPAAAGGATQLVDLAPVLAMLKAISDTQVSQQTRLDEIAGRVEGLGAMTQISMGTAVFLTESLTNQAKEAFFEDANAAAVEMHELMEIASKGK